MATGYDNCAVAKELMKGLQGHSFIHLEHLEQVVIFACLCVCDCVQAGGKHEASSCSVAFQRQRKYGCETRRLASPFSAVDQLSFFYFSKPRGTKVCRKL